MRKEIFIFYLFVWVILAACNKPDKPDRPQIYNVCDFGAVGDGSTLNSVAINRAIDSCHNQGGGIVFFPEGIYLSGSIRLKSNVTLEISSGSTLLGASNDIGAYDEYEENPWEAYQDFGHNHFRNALIWAENQENIAIIGNGNIHGGGITDRNYMPKGGGDKIISLRLCKNITIKDLRMEQGGHFVLLANGCDSLNITNLKVFTPRDGFNIISCQDVNIQHCFMETIIWHDGQVSEGDDVICLKSDFALGYPRESKNIIIQDCELFSGGANAFNIGSETVGNFSNIQLKNISIQGAEKAGIGITTNDGSVIDGVLCSNITISKCATPFYLNTGKRMRRPDSKNPGKLKNITLENIRAYDIKGYVKHRGPWTATISGIEGEYMAENITLRNVSIEYKGKGLIDWQSISPPDPSTGYSPRNLGERPAYGLYLRHAKNVTLDNVSFSLENEDTRPAIYALDIEGLKLNKFKAAPDSLSSAVEIALKNVRQFQIENSKDIKTKEL